ncbi:MAG: ion channel [bacterium]
MKMELNKSEVVKAVKNRITGKWWYHLYVFIRTNPALKVAIVFAALILLFSVLVTYQEIDANQEQFKSFFDGLWWAIVTISTVGYGEKVPVTFAGKIFAICLIFIGVGTMGLVTGRVASFIMERNMKDDMGLGDHKKMQGHFIICGWKREMNLLLMEILETAVYLSPLQIVLINRAPQDEINTLRSEPKLNGIKFVNGDYTLENDLIRAGIKRANRVLVLADRMIEGPLQQIDSQTVMTVMTIKNLNQKAYVCAELLDTKYEKVPPAFPLR